MNKKQKDSLEMKILEARVKCWESWADASHQLTGFLPKLISRIIQEFEKDFKVTFETKKDINHES